jgi:hypothetical protein
LRKINFTDKRKKNRAMTSWQDIERLYCSLLDCPQGEHRLPDGVIERWQEKNPIGPRYWGKYGWPFLHYLTFSYPEKATVEQQAVTRLFFLSVGELLPCPACSKHFLEAITSDYPVSKALEGQESLSRWLVNVHNFVNRRLGKPEMTYEQAKLLYRNPPEDQHYPPPNLSKREQCLVGVCCGTIVVLVAIIIALMIILLKKTKKKNEDLLEKKRHLFTFSIGKKNG